jgi:hypothetical protein
MSVIHVISRTHDVSCIKVLNHLVVKGGLHVCNMNHWDETTSCWVGPDKQVGHKISVSKERGSV